MEVMMSFCRLIFQANFQVRKLQSVTCVDADDGALDSLGYGCQGYNGNTEYCGNYDDDDFSSNTMCCACKNTIPNGKQTIILFRIFL